MNARALWTDSAPLLLASTSRTRRDLIESAGLAVEAVASGIDERALGEDDLAPRRLAERLASEKALAVSRRRPGRLVVGADQVLECDGEVLHKAESRDAARRQLLRLCGRTHRLVSAGVIARDGVGLETFSQTATLTVRSLDVAAIERYLDAAGDSVLSSVGCYQLEGVGIHLFESIEGDHSTILGLPLLPLLAALRRLGCLAL